MWQEMMEEEIQQIVILISSEDGANQVFVKKPIDYVGELKRSIDLYENDMLKKKNLSSSPNLFLG